MCLQIKIRKIADKVNKTLILVTAVVLLIHGCGEESRHQEFSTDKPPALDSSSVIIRYDVSGSVSGKIDLFIKNGNIRVNIKKTLNNTTQVDSRYINDGFIYYFIDAGGYLQGVKVPVIKDNNYHKSFTAFADAGEILQGMQKTGGETVSGKMCDVYSHPDGSLISVYDGKFVLKAVFGGQVITATEFNLNSQVPDSVVTRPQNFEFREIIP